MFELLDDTLKELLRDQALAAVYPELANADVSFVTPEKGFSYTQETLDLFLYETRENRELRDAEPITERRNGLSLRRRPPLRVECAYLVTAWSKKVAADRVAGEHQLLGQALGWLSRFAAIPQSCLDAAGLSGQVFAPPTMVAQLDPVTNAGQFWTALGIPPRPFFNLLVTIAIDLDRTVEDAIVTTVATRHHAADPAGTEELVIVGGTVRDPAGRPVADAWVRLEPAGLTRATDAAGRFVFDGLARGTNVSLRARARGFNEVVRANLEIPSPSGEYDLQFT